MQLKKEKKISEMSKSEGGGGSTSCSIILQVVNVK